MSSQVSKVINCSSKYTARAEELKEEAARLQQISKELRLKSIGLKFYNRFYSKQLNKQTLLLDPVAVEAELSRG